MPARSAAGGMGPVSPEEILRRLADGDDRPPPVRALDDRTAALARIAALVSLRACPAAYRGTVAGALAAGASVDEVLDTLRAVAPTVGLARVVSAAPHLADAVGYDVDAALEGRAGEA
jgi:4-carboxymuconolactone decarboxylase